MRKTPLIVFSVVVAIILLVVMCTFVSRPYEKVLLNRFGTLVEPKPIAYNLMFCYPTDTVVRVDTRLHLYQSILQQINTRNGEPISVRTFAAWQVTDPERFYTRMAGSDETAKQFLDQKISGYVQTLFSGHQLNEIFNTDEKVLKTDEIENTVRDLANKELKAEGMQISQVGFSRMAFPPNVAEAVYARMRAERMKSAAVYRAEGQATADQRRAEGNAEKERILAEAKKDADTMRGQGDAQAIEILSNVQGTREAKDFYQFLKQMDLFKSTMTKNTYLVLPSDNPLDNLLNVPMRTAPEPVKASAK